jgi:hypothetical protein
MSDPIAPEATPPAPAATTPPVPEPPKVPESPKVEAPADPWADPVAARAEIEKLRKENGAERTNAKAQAAEDAKKEMAQTIAKALGLVDDDSTDPAKLTEKLTESQTAAQQARVELAVFKAAPDAAGDPLALLDSTSFLKSLDGVDPSDTAAVQAAITAAITAYPRLGAETGPRAPAPNPAQGAGGSGAAPDLEAQIADATKAGDFQKAIALKQQRAAELKDKK